MTDDALLFKPYIEMPEPFPRIVWRAARFAVGGATLTIILLALLKPSLGLKIFWFAYIPLLPMLFLVAPGIWRNSCPLAAVNQIPRTLGFTRGWTVPPAVQQFTPLVSAALFVIFVSLRKANLDSNGAVLAAFLLLLLSLAFTGGVLFKGKSGWCSQFCPMLQIERFYGQAPLFVVRNDHCRPCVGCNLHCYDFNPTVAYLSDLHDANPRLGANRTMWAGALPWFIVAFFTQPYITHPTVSSVLGVFGRILLFMAAGVGLFLAIQRLTPLTAQQVALFHVVAALNLFYGMGGPVAAGKLGIYSIPLMVALQLVVAAVSFLWLWRAWPHEEKYLAQSEAEAPRAADSVLRLHGAGAAGRVEVMFEGGHTIMAQNGQALLDIAEANGVPIQSGCRMGMCGADPIRIAAGLENLTPVTSAEKGTLQRLGLGPSCRMACCAKVTGSVTVASSLQAPEGEAAPSEASSAPRFTPDPAVKTVVVVGNGIAGITAATEVRKLAPDVAVTLIAGEGYDFYNRMSINKIVSEASSIASLYLMKDGWEEKAGIQYIQGQLAVSIDREKHTLTLDDGKTLPYDRLVLATGAASRVPPVPGRELQGTYVLRTIDDGVTIQQYVRHRRSRGAAVVGGGALGLEAAHSLTEIGLRVWVLDHSTWPLHRQLDEHGGAMLGRILADLGITVLPASAPERIVGGDHVEGVLLKDGKTLDVSLCLLAAGNAPNVVLAEGAGLVVENGIVVNDLLQTSDPAIYAAGDVAVHRGRTLGLWPAALEQGRLAAHNLLGAQDAYDGAIPPTGLKVAGVDLMSVGLIDPPSEGGSVVALEDLSARRYRKLVLDVDNRVVGGILLSHPEFSDAVQAAVAEKLDVTAHLETLRAGDWTPLPGAPMVSDKALAQSAIR